LLAAVPVVAYASVSYTGIRFISQPTGTTNGLKGVHFVNGCTGFTVGETNENLLGQQLTIRRTDHSGRMWKNVAPSAVALHDYTLNRVDAIDKTHVVTVGETQDLDTSGTMAAGNGLVLNTANGGTSWANTTANLPSLDDPDDIADNEDVAMTGASTWFIAQSIFDPGISAIEGRILFTNNGGLTYADQLDITGGMAGLSFPTASTGYAVADGGFVWKTTDAGTTWTSLTFSGVSDAEKIVFANVSDGIVVGGSGAEAYTMDGGITWNLGTTKVTAALTDAAAGDATHFVAVGQALEGQRSTILTSDDGGVTWLSRTSPVFWDLQGVTEVPNTAIIFAVGQTGTEVTDRGIFC
jgi:photosystem II stability/assembly factor-like uncharacterized protein